MVILALAFHLPVPLHPTPCDLSLPAWPSRVCITSTWMAPTPGSLLNHMPVYPSAFEVPSP